MRRPAARVVGAVALAVLIGWAAAGTAAADPLPVDEPFTGTSFADPAWVLPDPAGNSAALTGSALRLTSPTPGFQQGNATLDDAFQSDVAFSMDFDYAAYGGANPGDAMTVFLMDGAATPGLGQSGGAAGYASMQGAYVAVGLDEAGNFAADDVFGNQPSSVVLRGAATATGGEGWPVLTRVPAPGGTIHSDPTAPRHVHVEVQPSGTTSLLLTVEMTPAGGGPLVTVYDHVDVQSFGRGQPSRPATLKLGFTAATGGSTDNYEVTNFQASADVGLSVTKSGPATVHAGGPATWTVVAANDATNPVGDAVLTDTVPAGVQGVTWTCTSADAGVCPVPASGTSSAGATIAVPLVLQRDQSATLTVTATVPDALAGTSVSDTATIGAASRTELTPADNTATFATRVQLLPDLAPTLTVTPARLVLGAPVSWTVVVANLAGDDGDATDSAVHVATPPLVDPASVVPPAGCAPVAGGFLCSLGPIAAGASRTLAFTGATTADSAACVAGPAMFSATTTTSLTDADPGNDAATAQVPCTVPVTLAISKSAPATALVGDVLTWSVAVTDAGTFDAPATAISDPLPPGVTAATWTCAVSDGSACAPAAGAGDVATSASIPAHGTATVTVEGRPTHALQLTNVASATACPACTADPATVSAVAVTTVEEPVVVDTGGELLAATGVDVEPTLRLATLLVVLGTSALAVRSAARRRARRRSR